MYVHIGKDIIIKDNEIITILDLEKMLFNKKLEDILNELNIENSDIIDISNKNNKSLLITKKDNKIKAYISNISSITLSKRIQKEII